MRAPCEDRPRSGADEVFVGADGVCVLIQQFEGTLKIGMGNSKGEILFLEMIAVVALRESVRELQEPRLELRPPELPPEPRGGDLPPPIRHHQPSAGPRRLKREPGLRQRRVKLLQSPS